MENMVSVIVLTYNEEATIARTLDSVLAQECHLPIEVIIGEDCSTDSTRAVCMEYADRHPGVVRLMDRAPNKGLIDNYYDCFLAARGRYIADCAGDDFWVTRDRLERQACILEDDDSVTLVHTDWVYYDEATGTRTPPAPCAFSNAVTPGREMLAAMVTQTERPVVHLCTAMYRADILREAYERDPYMFRNREFGCEDLQVCTLMAARGNIAYIPEVTLCYGSGGRSISSPGDGVGQFRFVRRVTDLSHHLCGVYGLRGQAIDRYFRDRVFALGMHAFRCRDAGLLAEAVECGRRWGVPATWRMSLLRAVTACPATWGAALWARRLFVGTKRGGA